MQHHAYGSRPQNTSQTSFNENKQSRLESTSTVGVRFKQENLNLWNLKIIDFTFLNLLGCDKVQLYGYCFANHYILVIRMNFAIAIFLLMLFIFFRQQVPC